MRSPPALFVLQLFAAVSFSACGCFVPVTEKQCDVQLPCGSNWRCVDGVCYPPDGGTGGGAAGGVGGGGGGAGGVGGGAGGGLGGGSGGGGGTVCGGCRDASGACQPGNTPASCGASGRICVACLSNQTCQGGACVTPPCNSSSCADGCCRSGVCVAPAMQSAQACGLNGLTCAPCTFGSTCSSGKCASVACVNCTGCCTNNICLSPAIQTVAACGSNGAMCMACPPGQLCINGACTNTPCSSSNCSGGCCENGKCVPFSVQNASVCGSFGGLCKPCPPGGSCSFGQCTGPMCGPSTCSGCCGPNGCQTGTSQFSCGANGQFCQQCFSGQVCQGGQCVTPPKKIGDPCFSSFECNALGASAYCKVVTSSGNALYPGGFCTRPCSTDGGSACTVDSVCLSSLQPYGEAHVFCSPRCTSMSQCRPGGYACYYINAIASTACWLNPIPSTGPDAGFPDAGTGSSIGAPCLNSGQCTNPSNTFCIQDFIPSLGPSGFVGGYCSALCSGVPCVAGSSCQSVTGFSTSITQQVCLRDCPGPRQGQSTCRNGYVCEGTFGATAGACLPRCNNSGASCPMGTACNVMTGYCN